jgi:hypothetical protein
VKAAGHDALGGVECLFDAVSVMAVDIDIEDARIRSKQLDDAQDDVVDVAEPRSLALLCMMQTARPINGDVCGAGRNPTRSSCEVYS